MTTNMLKDRGGRMGEHNEEFNRELENTHKNQTDLKNITEIKNTLEAINSRLNDTEEHISKLEDRVVEITQAEQKKEKSVFKRGQFKRPLGQPQAW